MSIAMNHYQQLMTRCSSSSALQQAVPSQVMDLTQYSPYFQSTSSPYCTSSTSSSTSLNDVDSHIQSKSSFNNKSSSPAKSKSLYHLAANVMECRRVMRMYRRAKRFVKKRSKFLIEKVQLDTNLTFCLFLNSFRRRINSWPLGNQQSASTYLPLSAWREYSHLTEWYPSTPSGILLQGDLLHSATSQSWREDHSQIYGTIHFLVRRCPSWLHGKRSIHHAL